MKLRTRKCRLCTCSCSRSVWERLAILAGVLLCMACIHHARHKQPPHILQVFDYPSVAAISEFLAMEGLVAPGAPPALPSGAAAATVAATAAHGAASGVHAATTSRPDALGSLQVCLNMRKCLAEVCAQTAVDFSHVYSLHAIACSQTFKVYNCLYLMLSPHEISS